MEVSRDPRVELVLTPHCHVTVGLLNSGLPLEPALDLSFSTVTNAAGVATHKAIFVRTLHFVILGAVSVAADIHCGTHQGREIFVSLSWPLSCWLDPSNVYCATSRAES